MNKKRRSNWYIYVITFVVTGLLLILVSSILIKSFYDSQDKDATVNVSQNQTAIFTPDSTYDFSVLVTLSADNDKTPDKYMTITYIAKNNTFVLMPYLPNAVIDGGNTIKQICEQSGEAEVAKLLSSKTGLSINKYVRFTKSTLTELFDMVGNTTLTVPSEIKYENKKDNYYKAGYADFHRRADVRLPYTARLRSQGRALSLQAERNGHFIVYRSEFHRHKQ